MWSVLPELVELDAAMPRPPATPFLFPSSSALVAHQLVQRVSAAGQCLEDDR